MGKCQVKEVFGREIVCSGKCQSEIFTQESVSQGTLQSRNCPHITPEAT